MGPLTLHDALLLLSLGVGCSGLAFVLCGYGLAHFGAGQGAVFANAKPLVGVILAICLLGEPFSVGQLASSTLILAGICLAGPLTGQPAGRT